MVLLSAISAASGNPLLRHHHSAAIAGDRKEADQCTSSLAAGQSHGQP